MLTEEYKRWRVLADRVVRLGQSPTLGIEPQTLYCHHVDRAQKRENQCTQNPTELLDFFLKSGQPFARLPNLLKEI